MKFQGNCPVQGFEVREGWLLYFRARDSWELRAWPPGTWRPAGDLLDAVVANWGTATVVDEDAEDDSFPDMPAGENMWPGWWSVEFCTAIAEWAIARVPGMAVGS